MAAEKQILVAAKIPPDLNRRINLAAEIRGWTVSHMVRHALAVYCEMYGPPKSEEEREKRLDSTGIDVLLDLTQIIWAVQEPAFRQEHGGGAADRMAESIHDILKANNVINQQQGRNPRKDRT